MSKRVAILHYAYPPSPGGVEKEILNHAEVLQKIGFEVKILTGTQIPLLGSINKFETDSDFYPTVNKVFEILEKELSDCDAVLVHNMLTLHRNLPFILAFRRYIAANPNKKYICWVHDHMLIEENKLKKNIKISKFAYEQVTRPIRNVTYVAISNTFASLLKKVLKAQIIVVPDGLDLRKELEIGDSIWDFAQKFDLLNRKPLLLCPANILERKNIEYSIKVVGKLKNSFPKICLVISGDTSKHKDTSFYYERLKKLVEREKLLNNILFLTEKFKNARSNKDLQDLYKLCDAVLYFSKSENFGLPLLETSILRVPIFVSDLKVFREIGRKELKYFKTDSVNDTTERLKTFFEKDKAFLLRDRVKSDYNLENILKEKLLPIING